MAEIRRNTPYSVTPRTPAKSPTPASSPSPGRPPHPSQIIIDRYQEGRRAEVERSTNLGVALTTVAGLIVATGLGESSQEIRFNVSFIEVPVLVAGAWEMAEGQAVTAGYWPTVSMGVLNWVRHDLGQDRNYYIGANLGIVTTGFEGQILRVHWQCTGKAFRNPLGSSTQVQ